MSTAQGVPELLEKSEHQATGAPAVLLFRKFVYLYIFLYIGR